MGWKRIIESNQLVEGSPIEAVFGETIIAVVRHEHAVYAVDGLCPHQGGPLARGKVANGCVVCPWHGWQFDLENGDNAVTCQPMLKTYPTRESGGFVDILIDD